MVITIPAGNELSWRADAGGDDTLATSVNDDIVGWAQRVHGNESSIQKAVTDTETLKVFPESWVADQDLCADGRADIDLEHLGIAAWSLDHHVLTVGLNQGGCVHAKFPSVLDVVYKSILPRTSDDDDRLSTAIVSSMVAEMFTSNQDEVHDDPFFVWKTVMSWRTQDTYDSISGASTRLMMLNSAAINLLRCLEYDMAVQSEQPESHKPHRNLYHPATTHKLLMQDDEKSVGLANTDKNGPRSVRRDNWPDVTELRKVWLHTARMKKTIYTSCLQDSSPSAVELQTELSTRLTQYPLECWLDAAVCAVDGGDFVAELAAAATRDFVQEIAFFRDSAAASLDGAAQFCLPVLLVKHQASGVELESMALNNQRLSCVSAAWFLAVLGIKDFPVYGLVTVGHYGYVSAAWFSSQKDHEFLYIADRNTERYKFDLSKKAEVTRFIKFLCAVKDHAVKLKERFEGVQEKLLSLVRTEQGRASLRWTLRSQIEQYNLGPHT